MAREPWLRRPFPLQWSQNGRDGVSNHKRLDCLLNRLSGADQRKHQSSASLAFVRGIHLSSVNSPYKGSVRCGKCFQLMTMLNNQMLADLRIPETNDLFLLDSKRGYQDSIPSNDHQGGKPFWKDLCRPGRIPHTSNLMFEYVGYLHSMEYSTLST